MTRRYAVKGPDAREHISLMNVYPASVSSHREGIGLGRNSVIQPQMEAFLCPRPPEGKICPVESPEELVGKCECLC